MFDDMMRRGTSTYSRYLTGFLVSIPLIFIAILILFLSSANDGKKRNITAIGMDTVLGIFQNYCQSCITSEQLEKVIQVDTCLLSHEWNTEELSEIEQLAPFGEGNQEPNFLLEGIKVEKVEKV